MRDPDLTDRDHDHDDLDRTDVDRTDMDRTDRTDVVGPTWTGPTWTTMGAQTPKRAAPPVRASATCDQSHGAQSAMDVCR